MTTTEQNAFPATGDTPEEELSLLCFRVESYLWEHRNEFHALTRDDLAPVYRQMAAHTLARLRALEGQKA